VVGQLQGTLDMQRGGKVAENLDNYYYGLRDCLLRAQIQVTPEELDQQIQALLELREAWVEVERSTQETSERPASSSPVVQALSEKNLGWSV